MQEAKENGWASAPEDEAGRMAWYMLWKGGTVWAGCVLSCPLGALVALLQNEVTLCMS